MVRAGVFIGVDKAGNLQKLNDAAAGARRMFEWALQQGMTEKTHARLITDAGGTNVSLGLIYDAIKEIVDGPGVEQLIVYFAGHGVNINRNEHWLLTDAPRKTSEAVNVSGSADLARYCGIPHVVFISDACRVAPEGIQAQSVKGNDIFPNEGTRGRAKPVDQFFACLLGMPAAEIRDPTAAVQNYCGLYTKALLDALNGTRLEVLDPAETADDSAYYVKPVKLKTYLESEVPRRVKELRLHQTVNQEPDAILTSGGLWLARIEEQVYSRATGLRRAGDLLSNTRENLRYAFKKLVRSAAEGNLESLDMSLQQVRAQGVAWAEHLAGTVEQIAAPFGPDRFETQCGIKVRGARIIDFFAPRANAELLRDEVDMLRIGGLEKPAASVLLHFEGNVCAVIPAISGFLAALTFENGELVDVAYEPSVNGRRWDTYKDRAPEVRALRAVAASSSLHGRFRLDEKNASIVAQKMQYAKVVDPTFAVYSAYAYHDLQAVDRIREMSGYLRGDVGVTFFDLALLSRDLINKQIGPEEAIVPFFPLLSQGWALLRANRVRLHPAIEGIESTMRSSLWTLFDHAGLDKLRSAMQTMEVL